MIPEIKILEKGEKEFEIFLNTKIKEYNNAKSPHHLESREPGSSIPLNIMLEDPSKNFIGGLAGTTYWEWLDIDSFYIPKDLRGKGIGSSILQSAETIAIKRGCVRCFVTTFEFQGVKFYEKQGYSVAGKLEDYPPGSTYYWMRKDFL